VSVSSIFPAVTQIHAASPWSTLAVTFECEVLETELSFRNRVNMPRIKKPSLRLRDEGLTKLRFRNEIIDKG